MGVTGKEEARRRVAGILSISLGREPRLPARGAAGPARAVRTRDMIGNDVLDLGRQEAAAGGLLEAGMSGAMPRTMMLPRVEDPKAYAAQNFGVGYGTDAHQQVKFAKGTTTLAFRYKGGVVVSVDSRSTMGTYIASGTVKKVIEINPYLLGTMAGGAADCSFWERNLGMQCRLFELRNKRRISVAAASKLLCNTFRQYRGYGLSCGTMVCGVDPGGDPQVFYCDDDGTRLEGDMFSVGSGSTYAYGVLDAHWRYDMTDEEAIALGRRAIAYAAHRDAYSGAINNLYIVRDTGWEFQGAVDTNDLIYQFREEKAAAEAKMET